MSNKIKKFSDSVSCQNERIKILSIKLKKEYDQHFQKQTQDEMIGFPDIIFWLHKINSKEAENEAKKIWEFLPPNQLDLHRSGEFFQQYAKQLIDKEEKWQNQQKKVQKLGKILRRTEKVINSLNLTQESTEMSYSELQNSKEFTFACFINEFSINDSMFLSKKQQILLEVKYKTRVMLIPLQKLKEQISEENQLQFSLTICEGSVFMSLYLFSLDSLNLERKLIAIRNLDLFSYAGECLLDQMNTNRVEFEQIDTPNSKLIQLPLKVKPLNQGKLVSQSDFKIILKRRELVLNDKLKKIKLKCVGYKRILTLLTKPFPFLCEKDSLFDNETIKEKDKQEAQEKNNKCTIF